MLQQLTNLSDKELISRARKLKDQEAEGVLLERYSHLLVAMSMPYINNGPGTAPEELFPVILQRLSNSLKTQTIPKASEWIHYTVKAQNSQSDRQQPYFPSTELRDIQQVELKVDKASNLLEQQQLVAQLVKAFSKLETEEKYFLQQFYIEQKSFEELAAAKKYPVDKVRQKLRQGKQKMASLMMTQSDGK